MIAASYAPPFQDFLSDIAALGVRPVRDGRHRLAIVAA